jgi:hypothetical protein
VGQFVLKVFKSEWGIGVHPFFMSWHLSYNWLKIKFNLFMGDCCCPSVSFGDIREPLFGASAFQDAKVRGSSPQLTVSLFSDILGEE